MSLLRGVRVFDLTRGWQRGCADLLADLGADVRRGDPALVDGADVVVDDGSDPGLPERLLRPGLVVVTLTSFGRTGPYAGWAASEATLAALGGVLSRSGLPGRPPVLPPRGLVHGTTCAHAAWAALVGLAQVRRTGRGELVDVSAYDAVVHGFDPGFGAQGSAAAGRADTFPRDRPDARAFYPVFDCLDGQVRICLLAPRQWRQMRAWLGDPDDLMAPELETIGGRFAAHERIAPAIAELFAGRTRDELVAEGMARGIPLAGVLSVPEVLQAPHFLQTGALVVRDGVASPGGSLLVDGVRAAGDVGDGPWEPRDEVVGFGTAYDAGRPLSGVRVLDLGVIVFGCELGRLLADQGADVLKVENPDFPDGLRQSRRGSGVSVSFAWGQRNKRSIGIDLRSDRGAAIFRDLVRRSDVVLANFKPGTLDALGFGHAALQELNPRVVTSESSAFGASGPWSARLGYGPLVRASCGVTDLWRDGDEPCDGTTVFPDHVAAVVVATAVLAALLSGEGAHLVSAQADIALGMLAALRGDPEDGVTEVCAAAGDDDWVVVTLRGGERFDGLLDGDDPGKALHAWVAAQPAEQALLVLQERGVAAGVLRRLPEELTDPQLLAREAFVPMSHPDLAEPVPASARHAVFSSVPDADQRPAPGLGRDTREVCVDLLGMPDAEVDALLAEGVLRTS